MEMKPAYEGSADGFAGILMDFEWETGTVIQLSDTIQSAERKSITFTNGIIVTKDTSDSSLWPTREDMQISCELHGPVSGKTA